MLPTNYHISIIFKAGLSTNSYIFIHNLLKLLYACLCTTSKKIVQRPLPSKCVYHLPIPDTRNHSMKNPANFYCSQGFYRYCQACSVPFHCLKNSSSANRTSTIGLKNCLTIPFSSIGVDSHVR